ncbi:unnamed protein product, partial [Tetraodon nigroviridis]
MKVRHTLHQHTHAHLSKLCLYNGLVKEPLLKLWQLCCLRLGGAGSNHEFLHAFESEPAQPLISVGRLHTKHTHLESHQSCPIGSSQRHRELSHLKEKEQNQSDGFIGLIDLHCVQGRYPPDFMDAWDTFNQKKCSENDRPDFFKKDQIFLILEFEFGGADLENSNGKLASLGVAKSILHQVTAALAVAEQELHFEHRDLHWGNVLVKPTKQKKGSFLLNGTVHSVETRGVLVRIIDYSLSRLEIDDLTVSCDISNDEELFMGQGDYQFDIYRLMRKENGNNWTNYHPHTNVLWLHYLCSKLLSMKYRSARGKAVKAFKEALTQFSNDVLQYGSATEVLRTCSMFKE